MHGLKNHRQVRVIGTGPKNRCPTHAIEQFENRFPMLHYECAQPRGIARNQRGRRELPKLQNRQFFIVITQRTRIVKNACALRLSTLQKLGRIEILQIERRILAHHDRIKICQRREFDLTTIEPMHRRGAPTPAVIARCIIGSCHGRSVPPKFDPCDLRREATRPTVAPG